MFFCTVHLYTYYLYLYVYRSRSCQTTGRQIRFGGISVDQRRRDHGAGDTHERGSPRRSAASGTRRLLRERRPSAAKLRQRAQKYP